MWIRILATMVLLAASPAFAASLVTLYKSPACGCCEKYVDYLRQNGFMVDAHNESDMNAIKHKHGVSHLASCHTSLVGGYVVEGHVPAAAIRKLLKEKPAIVGISVPGMPMNSPGMGAMRKGTLAVYAISSAKEGKPRLFSME